MLSIKPGANNCAVKLYKNTSGIGSFKMRKVLVFASHIPLSAIWMSGIGSCSKVSLVVFGECLHTIMKLTLTSELARCCALGD